jgi:hypothetical protein
LDFCGQWHLLEKMPHTIFESMEDECIVAVTLQKRGTEGTMKLALDWFQNEPPKYGFTATAIELPREYGRIMFTLFYKLVRTTKNSL